MKKKKKKIRQKLKKRKAKKKYPKKKKLKKYIKKRKKTSPKGKRRKTNQRKKIKATRIRKKKPNKARFIVINFLKINAKVKSALRFNFDLDRSLQRFFQGISNKISEIK